MVCILRHQFYAYEKVGDLPNFMFDLERNGLKLKQAEWNILQMGTTKYETDCKQIRFKNVYLETTHLPIQKTIPLMNDQVIDVRINLSEIILFIFQPTIEALVDYTNPLLNSYRSFTHDAILVHGFIPEKAETGTLKALFTISDGIRFVKNFDFRMNYFFK